MMVYIKVMFVSLTVLDLTCIKRWDLVKDGQSYLFKFILYRVFLVPQKSLHCIPLLTQLHYITRNIFPQIRW